MSSTESSPGFVLDENTVYLNGVNALTGQYLVPPSPVSAFAGMIKGQPEEPQARVVSRMGEMLNSVHLGLPIDRDPKDLKQSGWAIVFRSDEKPEVRSALQPLIDLRKNQIGKEELVKILDYKAGEGRAQWLARFRVAAGTVDPTKVPYYLLIVGSPEFIPFTLGFLLDIEYAVGRIWFDTPEQYASYSKSIVDYETKSTSLDNSKEILFFATRHAMDGATQLSADKLVVPLANGPDTTASKHGFRGRSVVGNGATKAALADVLQAKTGKPPALFFAATHGVGGWPQGDPRQLTDQGALLCQDWPGPGTISPDHYFSAADLPRDAHVNGIMAFLFACYSIGTPQFDRYIHNRNAPPTPIANVPFFSRLPQALLTHKNGGALACIGHVDRAWGYSISPEGAGPQLLPFQNTLGSLMEGVPIGHAVQDFNQRFAAVSSDLTSLLEDIGFGAQVADRVLSSRWIERNDAEGYVVFGDPATRLRLETLT
jgi:hypothetical protein